jgi:peptidoglycan/xylan/chitin deacetylase (PgdA/CDA1 family)
MSEQLQSAWTGFREWRLNAGQAIPVTLFVVAEQTTCPRFMSEMMDLLQIDTTILVGCHGLDHRCWSAWRPDPQGFQTAMESADGMLAAAFGPRYRRWFRAPGGYIAPWMAAPLATAGFVLDSSVNPSWLVRRKSGQRVDSRGFNGWGAVTQAIRSAGLIEREWAISSAASRLPLNGPALHLFPLSLLSRRYWCRISQTWATENELLDPQQDVCTYYWHILDHRRRNGRWVPPLPKRNNLEVRLGIATEQAI